MTVNVAYSTLNYKDGLAVTGTAPIARTYPMISGIDLAGTVESSSSSAYQPGDKVLITGWELSMTHGGGYAQKQRVKSEWLTRVPDAFSLKQAMAVGTAGYTAMLCILDLERMGVTPGEQEVIVTGAAGGVGSVAVAVLSQLGYKVAASTGRPELSDYLHRSGCFHHCRTGRTRPSPRAARWTPNAGRAASIPWADRPWPRFCGEPVYGRGRWRPVGLGRRG